MTFAATIILGLLAPQAFESITLLLVEMLVVDVLVGLSAFIVLSAIKAHVLAKTADINNSIAFVDSLSSFRTSYILGILENIMNPLSTLPKP